MNTLKKYLGIVWIAVAFAIGFYTIQIYGSKLTSDKQEDLVFGIIVFFILLPMIVTGLTIFGWYAITNEYKD